MMQRLLKNKSPVKASGDFERFKAAFNTDALPTPHPKENMTCFNLTPMECAVVPSRSNALK